jgi:cellulose synthase/poly-beta-1,6-N-acetylglucosamine synthase-like glycosyltransferase
VISFILPAYNEERHLASTLISLHAAVAELDIAYEAIVVDDASTDATAELATAYGATVITAAHRQIAATRNTGARHAKGTLLCFVDADTCIDSTVIRAALHALAHGAVGCGASVRLQGAPAFHLRWMTASIMWMLRISKIAPGCFLFCRREAFETVGGFDETLYAAEDVAISRALSKHGRFVVLRETVHTSDRKLRTFTLAECLGAMFRFALHGKRMLRSREHLNIWYEDRRSDDHEHTGR